MHFFGVCLCVLRYKSPRPHNNDEPGVVTGVILSLDNLYITPGDSGSATLTATVLPANPPNPRVKWTSSNPGVAAVAAIEGEDDKATVTGIAEEPSGNYGYNNGRQLYGEVRRYRRTHCYSG
jgi:hypothetical protein